MPGFDPFPASLTFIERHLGSPGIRIGEAPRAGEVVQVPARVLHNSYTGLVVRDGRAVREAPEF